jgi:ubiquinone/menaquinone biosynthesis C-methylase UbiE
VNGAELTPEALKACCATAYASEWATLLLGESFHPGGLVLTERLGRLLCLEPSTTLLDLAAGRGASAIHLARVFGCRVIGLDYGEANVEAAERAAREAGLSHLVSFRQGDAERLPLADGAVDAAICECAFCTFPDKASAARELARVIRPGGRLGLSDLTREGPLPPELGSLLSWVACLGDARPAADYAAELVAAGFAPPLVERHDEALLALARQVRGRLVSIDLLQKLGQLELPFGDLEQARVTARAAEAAVAAGQFGYALLVAARPVAEA